MFNNRNIIDFLLQDSFYKRLYLIEHIKSILKEEKDITKFNIIQLVNDNKLYIKSVYIDSFSNDLTIMGKINNKKVVYNEVEISDIFYSEILVKIYTALNYKG